MSDLLRDIVARNRAGECIAIPSVCSAHPEVLTASLQLAAELNQPLVIEATSNQVNQFGGYTGMDAEAFVSFVGGLIQETGIDPSFVVLGGDHLGPQTWKFEPAGEAMAKARDLVADYVRAGIQKIHLDCSEGCAGEPAQVDDETAATRAAELAVACRDAAASPDGLTFVIGTEVPPPGGARHGDDGHITPTSPESARATLAAHRNAFADKGIVDLWPQVSGVVVQPGMEFGPNEIYHLPSDRDPDLRRAVASHPNICLEAHSTDYQSPDTFPRLANLGFAFQKVGPALTFALRRALYALDHLLRILKPAASGLPGIMEAVMRQQPRYWQSHYGDESIAEWHFSYADRIRYYWPLPEVRKAVRRLLETVDDLNVAEYVLVEFFGMETVDRAQGLSSSRALSLVRSEVQGALKPYFIGGNNG